MNQIKKPWVSFCMSTFKRPVFLKDTIQTILQQSFTDFEIIVSDNDPEQSAEAVVKEINEPRIPSLKGMMRAKSAKIMSLTQKELNLDPQNIGLCGSPTQVVKIFTPPQRTGGQMLQGEVPEIVKKLVDLIKEEVH